MRCWCWKRCYAGERWYKILIQCSIPELRYVYLVCVDSFGEMQLSVNVMLWRGRRQFCKHGMFTYGNGNSSLENRSEDVRHAWNMGWIEMRLKIDVVRFAIIGELVAMEEEGWMMT